MNCAFSLRTKRVSKPDVASVAVLPTGAISGRPRVDQDWIAEYAEGVIALSGGRRGDIGQALLNGREDDARAAIERWQHCFQDRFYLELQRTGRADEERYLHAAVDLASRYSCPVVATNDVRFCKLTNLRRTRRGSVLATDGPLMIPGVCEPTPSSNICALPKKWQSSLQIFRRLWKTP
ncbi:MAG: hypothetical protein CM15mP74_22260 [Halieaceae bacterium]|nr:MAG: hypothetical protein CM15mP74_22260 [Halieaceae bacterium]